VKADTHREAPQEAETAREAPAAPRLSQGVAALLRAQQTAGNQAVVRLLQRDDTPGAVAAPHIVTVEGEQVEVSSKEEETEAKTIITDIKARFGIEVASMRGVAAVKANYPSAPKDVRKGVKTIEWKMKELRAIMRALEHYAPILGANRKNSSRKGTKQEITSVSKVDQSIDVDDPSGVLDTTTLGEFFSDQKNFSMFSAGTDDATDFPGDSDKQLEATAVHEIAHGLMHYGLADFMAATGGYWTDEDNQSGAAGAEAPPTPYGDTNAREDLSESVMMFFVDRKRLTDGNGAAAGQPGNPCPKRDAAIEKLVNAWGGQKGDFSTPANDGTAMA
jgi:hypothetical protein